MKLQAVKTLFEIKAEESVSSKKEMILEYYKKGTEDIETIAVLTGSKPGYVGAVLQREGLIDNYFDLYTSTAQPMNVYSKKFVGKLGFRNVFTAQKSVRYLEESYREFEQNQDRAGQHHTLEMGLTMLNRARWTGKLEEAEIYRRWVVNKLNRPLVEPKSNVSKFQKSEERDSIPEVVKLKLAA